jgi:hypothetical protein
MRKATSPIVFGLTVLAFLIPSASSCAAPRALEVDVCVYGGTSAGVIAAVQTVRLGKTVVLVEPGLHLGGLTTGGLGATDIGNKAAIGGLSREFYRRIAQHYAQDSAWQLETREDYFARNRGGQAGASQLGGTNATMWTFEPRIAENIFWDFINESSVPVYLGQPLQSISQDGPRIRSLRTPSLEIRATMFIDTTYEGDLLAAAGVSFAVGREANALYGETLNGIRPETPHHQFTVPVDPYNTPGDPTSGLLPFIQPGNDGTPGSGDHRVQAYNYRLCFTTNPLNRLPIERPADYDPGQYELLARYLEALVAAGSTPSLGQLWAPIWMPNHKTDINNRGGFSTDFIGMNYDYPTGGFDAREQIRRRHERYTRGFLTFLATSPRVPASIRQEMLQWGPAADEFIDTAGWPNQLYVREARRMVGAIVMTEHHCRGTQVVEDPIGLAAYNMDSHNCQRIVKDGQVQNEGDVQVPPMRPYPIAYRSIVPREAECQNLLVPVCLSASHIAYGSIRMEPVFMILGQSAATAAAQAIRNHQPVQQIDYGSLREQLLADHQVLAWQPPDPDAP